MISLVPDFGISPTPTLAPMCIPFESIRLFTTVNDANMFGAFCFIVGALLGGMLVYGRMSQRKEG